MKWIRSSIVEILPFEFSTIMAPRHLAFDPNEIEPFSPSTLYDVNKHKLHRMTHCQVTAIKNYPRLQPVAILDLI